MRNLFGGIIGCILGINYFILVTQSLQMTWPNFIGPVYFLLEGAFYLNLYVIPSTIEDFFQWFLAWVIVGIVIAIFSKSISNSIRTVLWSAVSLFLLLIAGVFIQNSSFWQSADRNFFLLLWFVRSVLTSMIALCSSSPLLFVKGKVSKGKEIPPPAKIETICSCGAVYKSKPLICAECGRTLEIASTLSSDPTAK